MDNRKPQIVFTFTSKERPSFVPEDLTLPPNSELQLHDAIRFEGSKKAWVVAGRLLDIAKDGSSTMTITLSDLPNTATLQNA